MRARLIQPKSEQKSRIPRIKFRIPKDKFRIHRDCFASLAMTEILEFHIEIPKRVLGDDIVGNSRIPKINSRIPKIKSRIS